MYELGDLTRAEYLARREQLQEELDAPRPRSRTDLERNGEHLRTLVDEWDGMTLDERRSLLAVVFPAIYAVADGLRKLRPHRDWLPYIAAAVAHVERESKARSAPKGTRKLDARSSPSSALIGWAYE